jgi:hypothetical protein
MTSKNHPLEILPVKRPTNKTKFKIPPPLLEPPFTYVFVAPTKSGKSVMVVNLLKNINLGYKDVFDQIYYISPTVMFDDTLNKAVADDDEIIKIHEEEDLENIDFILDDIVKEQKEAIIKDKEKAPHILVVLDDMLSYFKNNSRLDKLPALSRHYQISFIVTTQVFSGGLPTKLRKNASAYMVFQIYNNKDLKVFEEEIGSNFGSDFMENYHKATKDKYNFLYVNNREMELYHNFKDLLWKK